MIRSVGLQVGGKKRPDSCKRGIDLPAQLNDIVSFLHFDREQGTPFLHRSAPIAVGVLISTFHIGEVPDVTRLARSFGKRRREFFLIFLY